MAQRDEPGLRAVVQVALDAPQLGGLDVERAAAGARELVDALGELRLALGPNSRLAVDDIASTTQYARGGDDEKTGQNTPPPASRPGDASQARDGRERRPSRRRSGRGLAHAQRSPTCTATAIGSPNQTQTGQ